MNWEQNPRILIAARRLAAGEVIAYPTEAVWGLGCNPMDPDAVSRLLALKRRPQAKGLILIAASARQLLPFVGAITTADLARLEEQPEVPTTWVVPASRLVPTWLSGGRQTLAVRVTRHPLAAALCTGFGGPIVSTSANPQGSPPAKTALRVRCYFPGNSVHVVAGPLGKAAKPSEIRDLHSGEILRPGA